MSSEHLPRARSPGGAAPCSHCPEAPGPPADPGSPLTRSAAPSPPARRSSGGCGRGKGRWHQCKVPLSGAEPRSLASRTTPPMAPAPPRACPGETEDVGATDSLVIPRAAKALGKGPPLSRAHGQLHAGFHRSLLLRLKAIHPAGAWPSPASSLRTPCGVHHCPRAGDLSEPLPT